MALDRLGRLLWEYREALLSGIWVTIELAFISILIAMVVGLLACFGSLSRNRIVRAPAILFVEFCRNTPILVQMVWVHFAWPELLGYWGVPNLQVINRAAHAEKCATEAGYRSQQRGEQPGL